MGHYCWMCGRVRPNEKFAGGGHRRHICRQCAARPREERERIQTLRDTIGYLSQRNISAKNMAHLQQLRESPDDEVRQTAALVLEVGRVKPGRRGRTRWLARHRPDLLERLTRFWLVGAFVEEPDFAAEADERDFAAEMDEAPGADFAAEADEVPGADAADCEVPF